VTSDPWSIPTGHQVEETQFSTFLILPIFNSRFSEKSIFKIFSKKSQNPNGKVSPKTNFQTILKKNRKKYSENEKQTLNVLKRLLMLIFKTYKVVFYIEIYKFYAS
jgi:hypothetical protein